MPRHSVPLKVLEDRHVASGMKFTLEQTLKAHGRSRCISILFL
jgi:hypothetical protein